MVTKSITRTITKSITKTLIKSITRMVTKSITRTITKSITRTITKTITKSIACCYFSSLYNLKSAGSIFSAEFCPDMINPPLRLAPTVITITFSLIEKYLLLSPKNQKVATTYIQNRNMIRLHKNNKDKTYTDNKYKTYTDN